MQDAALFFNTLVITVLQTLTFYCIVSTSTTILINVCACCGWSS